MIEDRLFYPSTERNREAIAEVLRRILPGQGKVLEIGSGSGEHACYFAQRFPHLIWQPTDPEERHRKSIEAWRAWSGPPNLLAPLELDATRLPWQVDSVQAVLCINVVHVAPWAVCLAVLEGSGQCLPVGGVLYLYGAYQENGQHTTPSNQEFDQSLRQQNPDWGVRDLDEVTSSAAGFGLQLEEKTPMPSHNLSVVFRK